MSWWRVEDPSYEESMKLFHKVNKVLDTLRAAGMETTPGRMEDVLAAEDIDVNVTIDAEGCYIVKRI